HAAVGARRHRALEAAEDALAIDRGDPDAVIGDDDADDAALARGGDANGLAATVLHGVVEEVGDDLIDAEAIPVGRAARAEIELERAAGAIELVGEAAHHVAHQLIGIEILAIEIEPAGFDPRDVEELVDE